jgi:hypothetical protein
MVKSTGSAINARRKARLSADRGIDLVKTPKLPQMIMTNTNFILFIKKLLLFAESRLPSRAGAVLYKIDDPGSVLPYAFICSM